MLFLKDAVRSGYSILIAGGTGSGKTTFLNALSQYIPKDERVIVIEDTAELQIQNVENLVRMETRASGVEDCREITIRDLIRASLRMRPSRIIGIYGATAPIIPYFRSLLQGLYNSCRKASV